MTDLPEPLVPSSCDCSDLDGFMLNVERLMASELVALSSHEEIAAALFLWCRAWKQTPAASLPDDDRVNAAFARLTLARFKRLKPNVMRGFLKCSDGRLYHRVLAKEAICAFERKEAFRKKREGDSKRLREWREGKRETRDETSDETPSETRFSSVSETRFVAEGQGQGQGQGLELISQTRSIPQSADPPSQPPDALHAKCLALVQREPVACAQDFHTIEALLGDTITPADVLEGIRTAMRRSSYRFKNWAKFENWIRGAAQDRLGRIPRSMGAGDSRETSHEVALQGEKTFSIGYRDIRWTEAFLRERIAGWRDRGSWFEENWGPPPDRNPAIRKLCDELGIVQDRAEVAAQ